MNSLAAKYIQGLSGKKPSIIASCSGDVFVASVINQKVVNQSAQQVLAAIAAQILNVIEAQFGFSTNDDSDDVKL